MRQLTSIELYKLLVKERELPELKLFKEPQKARQKDLDKVMEVCRKHYRRYR